MTKQLSTYNFLFIGNSSVNKSNIINAFANYLNFGEFCKAFASEKLIQIVPSDGITTLIHPETFENFVIQDEDEHENEKADDGEIQNHLIKYQDKIIRIINSPDFEEDEVDQIEEKFETIIKYLQRFDKLHAICYFVKADSADEQIKLFEGIFSKLICNFSKSVFSNLIFCVSYNQTPFNVVGGNGHQKLKQLICEKLGEFEIELKIGENCFYLENDVYQFLRAKKRGFPCTKIGLDFYEENWNRSSERLKKLFDQIIFNVELHNLNESFVLSKAQKWIHQMEKPLDKLELKINQNLAKIQQETQLLQNSSKNKSNFAKITYGIQTNLNKVNEYQNELKSIEKFTLLLSEYIVINSNMNYFDMLDPHFDRLSQLLEIEIDTESCSEQKLQQFVETIEKKNSDNNELCQEIVFQSSKLTILKISGEFFASNLDNLNELANSSKILSTVNSIVELIGPILNSIILLNEKIESCIKKISEINEKNALKKRQFSGLNQYKVVVDLETKILDKPKMVCAGSSCRTFVEVNGKKRSFYKAVCHRVCFPHVKTTIGMIGEELLENCKKFSQLSKLCKICGCHWKSHKRILREFVQVQRTVLDKGVEKQILDGKKFIAENVKSIEILEGLMENYNEELKIIFEISTKFGYFLLVNSNKSFPHFNSYKEASPLYRNNHIRKFFEELYEFVLELVDERPKIGEDLIEDLRVNLTSLKHTESNFQHIYKIY